VCLQSRLTLAGAFSERVRSTKLIKRCEFPVKLPDYLNSGAHESFKYGRALMDVVHNSKAAVGSQNGRCSQSWLNPLQGSFSERVKSTKLIKRCGIPG
jgi:hypothetical protein